MATSSNDNLAPLLINTKTGEPYLQCAHPYSHIIITPPRLSDWEPILAILNDLIIPTANTGPPLPYLREHAEDWLTRKKNECDAFLTALEAGKKVVGGCPVRTIREVKLTGEEIFLGDCGIDRDGWPEVLDLEQRKILTEQNAAKADGDESIIWCMGGKLDNYNLQMKLEYQLFLKIISLQPITDKES